jgi:anti-anti-sigma regulatory factor
MDASVEEWVFGPSDRCPVCGASLVDQPAFFRSDRVCWQCGTNLWCRKNDRDGQFIIVPIPGRTATSVDLERLVRSIGKSGQGLSVGVDLSDLELVNSSFVSKLIVLNRRIQEIGGRMFLFAIHPNVRASLNRFRLDLIFEILEDEPAASWIEHEADVATP